MDADLFAAQSYFGQSTLDAAALARPAPDVARIGAGDDPRRAAEQFETFFLSQVLDVMTEGLTTEEPFGGGPGEETWRSFLNESYAQAMVRAGGIGLADRLTAEIIALQAKEAN